MPELGLPALFRRTVEDISQLDDKHFDAILDWLRHAPASMGPDAAVDELAELLPSGSDNSATRFLEFAQSTRRLAATFDVDSAVVAQAVGRAYQGPDGKADEAVAERVGQILDTPFIAIRAKSMGLAREAEHQFESSRCVTDLRPVFAEEQSATSILGFLVVHSLRLDLETSQGEDKLLLNITTAGLRQLRKTIDRAIQKEEALERLLSEKDLTDLTVRESSDDSA